MLIGSTAKKQRVRVHRARRTTDYGLPAVEVMFSFPEHPDAKMDSIVYGAGQLVTVEKS